MASTAREQVDTLCECIETSDEIADIGSDLLLQFSARLDLLAQSYSDHRHEKLHSHCTIMVEDLDDGTLAAALKERGIAEIIVAVETKSMALFEGNTADIHANCLAEV